MMECLIRIIQNDTVVTSGAYRVNYINFMTGFITLPLPTQGRGRVQLYIGCLGIPVIFQLVCHAFLSITFVFSSNSRSVEARNCCSDRRETKTQIGLIGKTVNCIGYQIRKPVSVFYENRKPNAKKPKTCKPQ